MPLPFCTPHAISAVAAASNRSSPLPSRMLRSTGL
jgi:hypothetical protein